MSVRDVACLGRHLERHEVRHLAQLRVGDRRDRAHVVQLERVAQHALLRRLGGRHPLRRRLVGGVAAQLVDDVVQNLAIAGLVDVSECGTVLVQEPLHSGQRVQGRCMGCFHCVSPLGEREKAPGHGMCRAQCSARGVAPNGVRDCEWSRVPRGSDEMELDWGERDFSWEPRDGMPAESRYERSRRVVTSSLAAMTSGGANYRRVERDFMRSAAAAMRSAIVVVPVRRARYGSVGS